MRGWRRHRGHAAETAVLRAAQKRGWQCLARNYASRRGELDLVLQNEDGLVIVEVRYRGRADYGQPTETVTAGKQARIVAAARAYLAAHPAHAESPVRFDVVGVHASGRLDWVENAFQAD